MPTGIWIVNVYHIPDPAVLHLPIIIVQPASATVVQNASATFSVSAVGSPAPTYQWFLGGLPIAGATNSIYLKNFVPSSNDGALVSVVVSNSQGFVISQNAILHVTPDATPPRLVSAFVSGYGNTNFDLVYSKPVDPASPSLIPTYSQHAAGWIPGPLSRDFRAGTIHYGATEPIHNGGILTVNHVKDGASNTIAPNSQISRRRL